MSFFRKNKSKGNEDNSQDMLQLKHLSKSELLNIILTQKQENEAVQLDAEKKIAHVRAECEKQIAALNTKITKLDTENVSLKSELEEQKSKPSECGSLAQEALRINSVIEATQNAANDYLEGVKRMHAEMSREYSCYESEAKTKADMILSQANAQAERIKMSAKAETEDIWKSLQNRFNAYCADRASVSAESSNIFQINKESV